MKKNEKKQIDAAKQRCIKLTIQSLSDEEIRTGVFRELHARRLKTSPADGTAEQVPSRHVNWEPKSIDRTDTAAKKRYLEEIKAEINGLQGEIKLNKKKAGKLMSNAVMYAKQIGDRLLFVKWNLLEHGKYEDWVENHFDGGLSTARVYTRIAKLKNWKRIVPMLYSPGGLTLEQALGVLKEKPEEKKVDKRRQKWIKQLTRRFTTLINGWPDGPLSRLVFDSVFMDRIEQAARKRNTEIRREIEGQQSEDRGPEQPLYCFPSALRKKVRARIKKGKKATTEDIQILVGRVFLDPASLASRREITTRDN